ncbi:hypothetical protein ABH926_006337 [Catenulispora sp. GP43]|uniref:helix-turn-helix domain-containing protein n=1 Tax=Catenulispora sp. GP43 TaxID=3156263 RepID=UPI003513AA72
MLESVGLPEPCGTVYSALVEHPESGAARLAEVTGLPLTKVRGALDRLTAEGMASRAPGRAAVWFASAPDVAIGSLVGRAEQELVRVRSLMNELMDSYREAARYTDPSLSVEVVRGHEEISRRFEHLQTEARHQIRGFDRPPYLDAPGTNHDREAGRARSGLNYRVIYTRAALAWPGRLSQDIRPSQTFEHARTRPTLPIKMVISDDRQALIPIRDPEEALTTAYVIHPSSLLDALIALFEAEWRLALPIPQAAGAGPDEETRSLLLLLASGQTDEAIARALGWSFRTTQRRVQALMRSLDATTRFQAGMEARGRGWV